MVLGSAPGVFTRMTPDDDDGDYETFRKVLQHKASPQTKETRTGYQKTSRLTLDAYMSWKSLHPNMRVGLYAKIENCARLVKTPAQINADLSQLNTFTSALATKSELTADDDDEARLTIQTPDTCCQESNHVKSHA